MSGLVNVALPLAHVEGVLEDVTAAVFDGVQKVDRLTGLPIWRLGLSARLGGMPRRVSIDVLVASVDKPAVHLDTQVVLVEATAMFWSITGGKSGVTRHRCEPGVPVPIAILGMLMSVAIRRLWSPAGKGEVSGAFAGVVV